mgnify:CR=1 FL=1
MKQRWLGLGLWAWVLSSIADDGQSGKHDPARAADKARELGAQRVYVKVCDGVQGQNEKTAKVYIRELRRAGIDVYAWGYLYDTGPSAQAVSLVEHAFGAFDGEHCSGYIANVEKQFADDGAPDAGRLDTMLGALRERIGGTPGDGRLAVSSYGRFDYFPKWPWHVLAAHRVVGMPQVYGFKSPLHAAERVRTATLNYARLGLPTVTTFGAFVNETMDHSPAEIAAALDELKSLSRLGHSEPGYDAWSQQHIETHPERSELEAVLKAGPTAGLSPLRTVPGLIGATPDRTPEWHRRSVLTKLGFYKGPIFGAAGAAPSESIAAFQRSRGTLTADGSWGPKTHAAMVAALLDCPPA